MSAPSQTDHDRHSFRATSRARSPDDALRGLTEWLTSDRVLRRTEAGAGVANWLWPNGAHDGLYPEIGGYYLQFLSLAECRPAPSGLTTSGKGAAVAAREAAASVIEWLEKSGPQGDPLTLYHRDMTQSDWRNKCLFAFDLAMILRGLASVESRWPGIVPTVVMARYSAAIRALVGPGGLRSHQLRPGASEHEVPVKWSTRVDVHHVKIAAALSGVGPQFAEVVSAIIRGQTEAMEHEGTARMRELHPFLYLVEGWLMLWGQCGSPAFLDYAGTAFRIVLREFNSDGGTLPPIAGRRDLATRADVLAQALRAGLILEHAGWLDTNRAPQWSMVRQALEDSLLGRLAPGGGIEFDEVGRHSNVWASLFAWQALEIIAQARSGLIDARKEAVSLI